MGLTHSVISPGDSANDDGTGDSTIGTLNVEVDLIMGTSTELAYQFNGTGEAGTDYDCIAVNGSLTLDGTLDMLEGSGFGGGWSLPDNYLHPGNSD